VTRAVILGVAALALACERPTTISSATASVAVDRERVVVTTGTVGIGEHARRSTYVLASARNTGAIDLLVTLRGDLVESSGARHELLPESLRVPAGGERTFALVLRAQEERAGATAEVVVSGALPLTYDATLRVAEGHVYQDQGRAVVAGRVANDGRVPARVPVFAAFYDPSGRPVARPFTVIELAPGGARAVQLVGPSGSTEAQLYLGEAQF
jgi:hypothetical protein